MSRGKSARRPEQFGFMWGKEPIWRGWSRKEKQTYQNGYEGYIACFDKWTYVSYSSWFLGTTLKLSKIKIANNSLVSIFTGLWFSISIGTYKSVTLWSTVRNLITPWLKFVVLIFILLPSFNNGEYYVECEKDEFWWHCKPCYYIRLTVPQKDPLITIPMSNGY